MLLPNAQVPETHSGCTCLCGLPNGMESMAKLSGTREGEEEEEEEEEKEEGKKPRGNIEEIWKV